MSNKNGAPPDNIVAPFASNRFQETSYGHGLVVHSIVTEFEPLTLAYDCLSSKVLLTLAISLKVIKKSVHGLDKIDCSLVPFHQQLILLGVLK